MIWVIEILTEGKQRCERKWGLVLTGFCTPKCEYAYLNQNFATTIPSGDFLRDTQAQVSAFLLSKKQVLIS